ncbi:MAG: hypothetical protein J7L39_01375, partial [Candidatus Aenigmarchaeota archaeon]|nr:hypothetical protein [Candidatus Aenigmarchaeota archaeon]
MLKGFKKEISDYIGPIENEKDDIFIVCASFEDRTTAVVKKLSEKYHVEYSFVFKYDEQNRTNLREEKFNTLINILSKHSENIFPIICDHYDPMDGVFKLKSMCKNNSIEFKNKNITIDITTFTK